MPTLHSILDQEETTVEQFSDKSSDELKEFIKNGCIAHYKRNGERTIVNRKDFRLKRGDFLIMADQCLTGWKHLLKPLRFKTSNYAFVHPNDNFGLGALLFLDIKPSTFTIRRTDSLEDDTEAVISSDEVNTPIDNVFIVSHANEGANLFIPLDEDDEDDMIDYYELCEYVCRDSRPDVTTRYISNDIGGDSNIHIRGCNIGQEKRFLDLIQQLFGGKVTVTAPKHTDGFSHFLYSYEFMYRPPDQNRITAARTTVIVYEFMLNNFALYLREQVDGRGELVDHFENKNFTNIHGENISDSQWDDWIPSQIHPDGEVDVQTTYVLPEDVYVYIENDYPGNIHNQLEDPVSDYLEERANVYRNHSHGAYEYSSNDLPVQDEIPISPEGDKKEALREEVEEIANREYEEEVPSSCSCEKFPWYENIGGVENLNDYIDLWAFVEERSDGEVERIRCIPPKTMHEYVLKIPITNSSGEILVNAFTVHIDEHRDFDNFEDAVNFFIQSDADEGEIRHDLEVSNDKLFRSVENS